jgi:hypothetical protein
MLAPTGSSALSIRIITISPYTRPISEPCHGLAFLAGHNNPTRGSDDLAEKMRGIGLGGTLALLNQKASQRKPPAQLEWEESEEGKAHQRTFNVTLRGKPHDISST